MLYCRRVLFSQHVVAIRLSVHSAPVGAARRAILFAFGLCPRIVAVLLQLRVHDDSGVVGGRVRRRRQRRGLRRIVSFEAHVCVRHLLAAAAVAQRVHDEQCVERCEQHKRDDCEEQLPDVRVADRPENSGDWLHFLEDLPGALLRRT